MFTRALLVTAVALFATAVEAATSRGSVRVDFEDGNYAINGQGWDTIQFADVANNGNVAVDIGFDIDFGSGPTHTMFINENGYVSFNDPIDFVGAPPSLASLGGPIIAPYYANLESTTPPAGTFAFFTDGAVAYSTGVLDLADPFDHTNDLDAIRVNWTRLTDSGNEVPEFQLVLYRDPDDPATTFGLEFNYDAQAGDLFPQLAGFVLGARSANLDLNDPNTVYAYSFSAGGTPPTQVPEPDSLWLLVAGLLALPFARYARRGAPQLAR